RTKCQNNLRQVVLAAMNCHNTHNRLPPGWGNFANAPNKNWGPTGEPRGTYSATLFYHLLPFLEENSVYGNASPPLFPGMLSGAITQLSFRKNDNTLSTTVSNENRNSGRHPISVYYCPAEENDGGVQGQWSSPAPLNHAWGIGSVAMNWQIFTLPSPKLPDSIPDGAAKTVMFTEKYVVCNNTGAALNPKHGGALWAFPPGYRIDGVNVPEPTATTPGEWHNYAAVVSFGADINND